MDRIHHFGLLGFFKTSKTVQIDPEFLKLVDIIDLITVFEAILMGRQTRLEIKYRFRRIHELETLGTRQRTLQKISCSSETQGSWTHVRRNGKLFTGFIHSPFTKTKRQKTPTGHEGHMRSRAQFWREHK